MYVNNWVTYIKMQEQLRKQKVQSLSFDMITGWGGGGGGGEGGERGEVFSSNIEH